jgi:hypothetical protein
MQAGFHRIWKEKLGASARDVLEGYVGKLTSATA